MEFIIVLIHDILVFKSVTMVVLNFNPTVEKDGCEYDYIKILMCVADKIDYSWVLGLNSTVIIIKNF